MIVSTASFAVLALFAGAPVGDTPPAATGGTTTTTTATSDGGASLVIVVTDGGTRVHNLGSSFVSVTPNAGKTQVVPPGAKAEFTGAEVAQAKLQPPSLLSPSDRERVKAKPTEKGGLGPIVLSWAPVAGVREYEVELQVDNGKPTLLKVQRPECRLAALPPGKVLWAVRSVADGATSESSRRWFELQPDHKLEVGTGVWK